MNKTELKTYVNSEITNLNDDVFDQLENLMNDTLLTNEKFNLTAITDEESFRELMIYDSLTVLKYVNLDNKDVLDVGTGAGYPGLPLCLSSKGNFTLLDSTQKKINHINEYVKNNNIPNCVGVSARAEEYAIKNRDKYDIVISRAVARLNILLELCIPLVKVGGYFIAMKGSKVEEEIKEAKNAFKKLNCEVVELNKFQLPLSKEERNIVLIKKMETSNKYPRKYSEIKRKPL